jgi:Flp pilus assembly protein TadG
MMLQQAWRNEDGTAAIEFGLTAPAFFLLLFGILQGGLLFWTQIGMQHGTEMAARCASINTTICPDETAAQTYAAQQSFGLKLPSTAFTVQTAGCGKQVTASYTHYFLTSLIGGPKLELSAQACFPT